MDFSYGISIVMTTYNTDIPMLKKAVDSILDQTFKDFEFIIIDDGSVNGSDTYLKSIPDSRVKLIFNPENLGVTKSLNIGFDQAAGKYIARMDADDISLPTRLEKEYNYMEKHPEVIVCGSETADIVNDAVVMNSGNDQGSISMDEYRVRLLFKNPGPVHPTAMFRHESLLKHNIAYDETLVYAQDYGMWECVSNYGSVHILNEVLLYRRKHEEQISVAKREIQMNCDKITQKKILTSLLGNVTDEEVDFHYIHSTGYFADSVITPEAEAWYDRLLRANKVRHIYDQRILKEDITRIKKKLVVHSFDSDMKFSSKIKIINRYIPFSNGVRMIAGHAVRSLRSMKKDGNSQKNTW